MRKIAGNQKGIATVYAGLLTIILLMALLAMVVSLYINYEKSIMTQMQLTQQKAEEKIMIPYASRSGNNLTVYLSNLGSIELEVRGLYFKASNTTKYASDPAITIQPSTTETYEITVPPSITGNYSIIASTERGTLSKEYFVTNNQASFLTYDVDNIVLGSLRLRFTSFQYCTFENHTGQGQWSPWISGWTPPIGEYLTWRVEVVNISNETISLNDYTSFTISSCDGPNEDSWFIKDASKTAPIPLPINVPTPVEFRYSSPDHSQLVKITSGGVQDMVFLTFFGTTGIDKKPFGETIPFLSITPGGS